MTKKITISIPDEVAERLRTEENASRYFTELARRDIYREQVERHLIEVGVPLTEEGRVGWRRRLSAARANVDGQSYASVLDPVGE